MSNENLLMHIRVLIHIMHYSISVEETDIEWIRCYTIWCVVGWIKCYPFTVARLKAAFQACHT